MECGAPRGGAGIRFRGWSREVAWDNSADCQSAIRQTASLRYLDLRVIALAASIECQGLTGARGMNRDHSTIIE
jgi:hypothetical protein